MKSTTRKLSGLAMERALTRLLAEGDGIEAATATALAKRLARVISSIRVRRVPLQQMHRRAESATATPRQEQAKIDAPSEVAAVATPTPTRDTASPAPPAKFDPYQFGLVPVYQREGRDGLVGKLQTIASVDQLRAMAKAQQIALDASLKSGEVGADVLRAAIVTSVEKRIADRRAAAS